MYWQARQPDSLAASSGSRKRNFIIPFFYRILRSERKERRRSEWFRWKAPSVWELAMTRVICLYIGLTATFESYKPASHSWTTPSLIPSYRSQTSVVYERYSRWNIQHLIGRFLTIYSFIHSVSFTVCQPGFNLRTWHYSSLPFNQLWRAVSEAPAAETEAEAAAAAAWERTIVSTRGTPWDLFHGIPSTASVAPQVEHVQVSNGILQKPHIHSRQCCRYGRVFLEG